MTAKTPNIRYIVAKTHLPQFMRFLKQQMSPFYPFRGGGVAKRGKCHLLLLFFYIGASLTRNAATWKGLDLSGMYVKVAQLPTCGGAIIVCCGEQQLYEIFASATTAIVKYLHQKLQPL